MYSLSITENESSIESTDTTVVADETTASTAKAVSVIVGEINYDYSTSKDKTYFVKGVFPLMASPDSSAFLVSTGMNWFFGGAASVFSFNQNGSTMHFTPKFRYYLGASLGAGYVSYSTESSKKNDTFFDVGFQAGLLYNLGRKWGMRFEAGMGRGTGVISNSMGMKIFFGSSYYL
jgi:hypothetical protein